jgi:hypothetical protein
MPLQQRFLKFEQNSIAKKPSIEIKGTEIFVHIASASTKLASKIVGENSQGCVQVIVAENNLMEYCLEDADTIKISKASKTANSVDEMYRRSKN